MISRFALTLAALALASLWSTAGDSAAAPGGGAPRIETPRPEPSGPNKKKEQARETDFQQAEYLIKAEKFDEAIPLLQKVVADNPRDADAWNYLGFASRKIGKLTEALGYYDKALKLNPNHKGANEYLGELYLMMNDLPKAEAQLAKLKSLCPAGCEELEDFEAEVADYKANLPK
jgi:tetratricopeptide (TPR) repeat protein